MRVKTRVNMPALLRLPSWDWPRPPVRQSPTAAHGRDAAPHSGWKQSPSPGAAPAEGEATFALSSPRKAGDNDSIADAVADLGRPDEIGKMFAGFQRYLYQPAA